MAKLYINVNYYVADPEADPLQMTVIFSAYQEGLSGFVLTNTAYNIGETDPESGVFSTVQEYLASSYAVGPANSIMSQANSYDDIYTEYELILFNPYDTKIRIDGKQDAITPADAIVDADSESVVDQLNSLLAALRTQGLVASS